MRQWWAGRAMIGVVCAIAVGVGLLTPVMRLPVRAAGQTFTVTRIADDKNDAACNAATSGGCTLREAVNASNANDPGTGTGTNTIAFAPGVTGTIALTTTGTGYGTLIPTKNVTIIGPGAGLLTISGQFTVRVFKVNTLTFGVQDLTIANGWVSDSSDTGYFSGTGAGIAVIAGTLNLVRVVFSGNSVTQGGGAINAAFSSVNVTGCLFFSNSASLSGGAINMETLGDLRVTNSTFSRNTALFGAAIYQSSVSGLLIVTSSTVSQNTTPDALSDAIHDRPGAAIVASSIVSGNGNACCSSGMDILPGYTDGGGNVIGGTALLDVLNTNAPGTIPTYAPLPGSPAIDIATCPTDPITNATLATDARGVLRPQSGLCDAGAFESRGFALGTLHGNTQAAPVGTAYAAPLSLTVTSASGEPVAGGQVTFTAPATGAGAGVTFSTGSSCTLSAANTVATCPVAGDGTVTSRTPTANGIAGVVTISATARGVSAPAPFQLGNAPTLTAIGPTSGDVRGGTTITVRGAGFGTDPLQMQVSIDGAPVPIMALSPTALTVIAPAHVAGSVPVSVAVQGVGALTPLTYTYGVVHPQPSPKPTRAPTGNTPNAAAPTHAAAPTPLAPTPKPLPQPLRH